MGFYEQFADHYAQVTGQHDRQPKVSDFLGRLLRRHPAERALDVACGTGLFAIELARRGVSTVGADLSSAMIAQARAAAREADVGTDWLVAPMQELGDRLAGPFDLLLCMGNSLPHLLEEADLAAALSGFADLLAPGGLAVVHLLNYDRILTGRQRLVGINRDDAGREYVRFYDFLDNGRVRFNLLSIDWSGGGEATHELIGTELRPYTQSELTDALQAAGFDAVEPTAGLSLEPYNPLASGSLTLLAWKRHT